MSDPDDFEHIDNRGAAAALAFVAMVALCVGAAIGYWVAS